MASQKHSKKSKAPARTWLTNAEILTQNETRDAFVGSILIEGDRIAEIVQGKPKAKWTKGRDTKIQDLSGHVLIPGFVQTHVHLCQTLFRHMADDLELLDWLQKRIWKFEAAHTAATLEVSALLGIHELLASGTTTILDMGTVRHTEVLFKTALKTGIRANIGKCLMDHPQHTPANLRDSTKDAVSESVRLFEKWNGRENGRILASFAPRFAVSCTKDLMIQIGKIAAEKKAVIHTHASENQKEVQFVRELTGMENISYLKSVGILGPRSVIAHGVWLSDSDRATLKETGTAITHCPSSNLKLASGIADIVALKKAGVTVALGADGAPCNNSLDAFQEMRLAALLQKPKHGPTAMTAQEAFDLSNREGARALGLLDQIGSLEIGKKADLCALKLDSYETLPPAGRLASSRIGAIIYSGHPGLVRQTWVDGRVVFSHGKQGPKVPGIDPVKLLQKAKKAQAKILKSVESMP
ncbi:MAG: 5'-deoxyadenosine deaminase [Bdellovibrionales bacterium]|nr:5'-deoxyadenosine deaminase [Bdellovibrionales bacterium]